MIPSFLDRSLLPHKPGVYIFKNDQGVILYVGKAIDLYHRVASYFNGIPINTKTTLLVAQIKSVATIVVASELEALILEANLIKKYQPAFNIKLTDDKDYLYIKITKEDFPRILTARKNDLADAKDFFGPFPSSNTVRITLKKMRRIFPWCASQSKIHQRACFYYHLNLCPGACVGKINQIDYNKIINKFRKFMQGKKEELIKELNREMEDYAKSLQFEKAQNVKKMINGLEYLTSSNNTQAYLENPNFLSEQDQLVLEKVQQDLTLPKLPIRIECFDISNIQGKFAVGSMVVLSSGEIDKSQFRKFKILRSGKSNDVAMISEMITRRVKHNEWPRPDLILIDGGRGQVRAAEKIVEANNWRVPVYGLAKRLEWLYTSGQEIIKLPKSSLTLKLLQKIRDEAHRVAVSYHRKLRDQQLFL